MGSDDGLSAALIDKINSFLLQVKLIINDDSDNFIVMTHRPKNEKTMLKLGFTPKHVGEVVCGLTYKDYSSGPEPNISKDGRQKGSVWVFGKKINGLEIYIKIQLISDKKFSKCVCISFHEADYPLNYPNR